MKQWKMVNNGIAFPKGYKASGINSGIKSSGEYDLGLIVTEKLAVVCGAFTQNRVKAAPVLLDMERTANSKYLSNGIIVNSGIANACTGKQGDVDAKRMTEAVEKNMGFPVGSILVCSTGVIGQLLPIEKIEHGIQQLSGKLSCNGSRKFATAIMTTDTKIKQAALELKLGSKNIRIGGACKGSGMINPNLATMLAFITTDAKINKSSLNRIFKKAVSKSFNRITVDGDSSTNDTVLMLANGTADNNRLSQKELSVFGEALEYLMVKLAKMIVGDGEGATKLVEIEVTGAADDTEAQKAAKAVANSQLVKTAVFGNDPNWGRILCAAGYSGAEFDSGDVDLQLCGIPVLRKGQPIPFDSDKLTILMKRKEVDIKLCLGRGKGTSVVWTCDLSYEYVKINAEYHT